MAIGVIILVVNIIITIVKNVQVGNDPWGDGRTLRMGYSINQFHSTTLNKHHLYVD